VSEQQDRFNICTISGRIIMTCGDTASAGHYATLLNEAFAAGYKQGFRDSLSNTK
jgi:hypothetical protein